jgi:hypothetical protein
MSDLTEFFGEPIHSYTRHQAIEDGVLVDVSEMAREAGIRFSVAVTRRLWDEWIVPDAASADAGQDQQGRLWDVLWMLRAATCCRRRTDRRRQQPHPLLSAAGGAAPVATIMPGEHDDRLHLHDKAIMGQYPRGSSDHDSAHHRTIRRHHWTRSRRFTVGGFIGTNAGPGSRKDA